MSKILDKFQTKAFKFFELIFIFVVLPLLFILEILPKEYKFLLLWAVSFYALFHMRDLGLKRLKFSLNFKEFRLVLKRFLIFGTILTAFSYAFFSDDFLRLPKEHFRIWLLVLLLYPFLSALFQEVVFRAFFTKRYKEFFKNDALFIAINATLFGFVHLLFGNFIAVILSFFGSIIFLKTYLKTGSLLLVTLEHALYGNLIFTIGLGRFFYNGS